MQVVDFHAQLGQSIYGDQLHAGALLARMDTHQVDLTVIASFTPPDLDFAEANREIAAIVQTHPDRFMGAARIDPRQTELSKDEIRRVAERYGFRGIVLHPMEQGFKVNDPLVIPVLELAAEHGLFVHVETGFPILSTPMQVAQLARQFPSTPFILAHMGSDSYFGDAVKAAILYPNLYLETSGHVLTGEAKNGLRMAVEAIGAERLLFATDAPYFDVGIELLRVEVANLPQETRALILGGNSLRLLGKEPSA